jgi:hypothetical protein
LGASPRCGDRAIRSNLFCRGRQKSISASIPCAAKNRHPCRFLASEFAYGKLLSIRPWRIAIVTAPSLAPPFRAHPASLPDLCPGVLLRKTPPCPPLGGQAVVTAASLPPASLPFFGLGGCLRQTPLYPPLADSNCFRAIPGAALSGASGIPATLAVGSLYHKTQHSA